MPRIPHDSHPTRSQPSEATSSPALAAGAPTRVAGTWVQFRNPKRAWETGSVQDCGGEDEERSDGEGGESRSGDCLLRRERPPCVVVVPSQTEGPSQPTTYSASLPCLDVSNWWRSDSQSTCRDAVYRTLLRLLACGCQSSLPPSQLALE